jgi:hypothetical protein
MKRWVSEKVWISDYNDELTEYVRNVRLYGDFKNMIFFV